MQAPVQNPRREPQRGNVFTVNFEVIIAKFARNACSRRCKRRDWQAQGIGIGRNRMRHALHMLRRQLPRAVNALGPMYCRLCDMPSDTGGAICAVCRGELQLNRVACSRCALPLVDTAATAGVPGPRWCPECLSTPPALSRVLAPLVYDPALAWLIGRWKYRRDQSLDATFAMLWLWAVATPPAVDCLLAIPLHWRRLLWRGFNQSEDLCRALQSRLAMPRCHAARGLRLRRRPGAHQAGSTRRVRLQQLQDVFSVQGSAEGLRIALVDDVCTTGATGNAAARVLLAAGAREVQLWCLARTPKA
jgi:ComF family protein